MSLERNFEIATIVLFVGGLLLPLAKGSVWGEDPSALEENRRPSEAPELTWTRDGLESFPRAFESYYDDHFGLRSRLVRIHHTLMLQHVGASPSSKVMIGRDGFLFYTPSIAREMRAIGPRELSSIEKVLRHLGSLRPGLRVVLAVVPNKASIYPENLPRGVRYDEASSRLTRLEAYLRERAPEIDLVEMRAPLRSGKERALVYRRGDSHWSHEGQRIGYESLLKVLGNSHLSLAQLEVSKLEPSNLGERKGDLGFHLSGIIPTEREAGYSITTPSARIVKRRGSAESGREVWSSVENPVLPKAVLLHDSFFATHRLVHGLLRESFSELYALHGGQNASRASVLARLEELAAEKEPDFLIIEVVERNIDQVAGWMRHLGR